MNWMVGIGIYTLICIKWITNKNLLCKKINKIKLKKKMTAELPQLTMGLRPNKPIVS